MKINNMHLRPDNINAIISRTKKIEIRLNDKKRRELEVGDEIIFTNSNNKGQNVKVVIEELIIASDFKDLFSKIDLDEAGWDKEADVQSAVNDMRKYYSEAEEKENGVVAIKIKFN